MEHKVLIADDSLTIQKVIKITLANEPFELHDCADADSLVDKVKNVNPAMVLLDFNLSEKKTGYDLCREIKNINPDIGVLMLFGTFDTIDEELLTDCGCNYHIVKPFDGTKFINLCRALANDYEAAKQSEQSEDADFSTKMENEEIPEKIDTGFDADEDEWIVKQPELKEEAEEAAVAAAEPVQNKLEAEVEEWGMEIPSVIGKEASEEEAEIPSVIGDQEEPQEIEIEMIGEDEEKAELPKSEDLEYPELGVFTEENEHIDAGKSSLDDDLEYPESVEMGEPVSKLVPMDELKESPSLELEGLSEGTDTEEGVRSLQEQIKDEVEEEADLWAADVVEKGAEEKEPFKAFESRKLEKIDVEELEPAEAASEPLKKTAAPAESLGAYKKDLGDLEEKLRGEIEKEIAARVSPLVEKFVKQYCQEQIEKVAWEVIPDLAENIIKREIQKISDSIMDQ